MQLLWLVGCQVVVSPKHNTQIEDRTQKGAKDREASHPCAKKCADWFVVVRTKMFLDVIPFGGGTLIKLRV